jgi:thioredoxin 1
MSLARYFSAKGNSGLRIIPMPEYSVAYNDQLTPAHLKAIDGPIVLNFGAGWCGHCQLVWSAIMQELKKCPEVKHFAIEDGRGRKLGAIFRVKLWPTLIFLKNGEEVTRLVRPTSPDVISTALHLIC